MRLSGRLKYSAFGAVQSTINRAVTLSELTLLERQSNGATQAHYMGGRPNFHYIA